MERCGSGSRVFPRIFFQDAYDDDEVIEKLIGLVRELGHFPRNGRTSHQKVQRFVISKRQGIFRTLWFSRSIERGGG
jgi:hypothetical protein